MPVKAPLNKAVRKPGPRPKVREYHVAKGTFRKHPERDPEREPTKIKRKDKARIRPVAQIAKQYAEDVRDGKIPACKFTHLACERHLRDLDRQRTKDFPYYFDGMVAAKIIGRMEQFPHIKGRWARRGELLALGPWQVFCVAMIVGWKRLDGTRRFREAYLEIARKNAKSTMAAALGNVLAFDDEEFGAEVYAGATTEKQAWEVFGPARLMLERSPKLCEEMGIEVWARALVREDDNSSFKPVIGNPGDGPSPSCAIVDEYHEHDSADLVDTMVTGMGAREQPLLLIITTAGTNLASPCHEKSREAKRMLESKAPNEELFAILYGIDEKDDPFSPDVIAKANPNIGVSVDREYLVAQQVVAKQNPAYQNRFKTKHLNVWCGSTVAGINMAAWAAAANPKLRIEDFADDPCWVCLDLASKIDICADVRLFVRWNKERPEYFVFGNYYLPEDTVAEATTNKQAYNKWVAEGHLIATEGAEVDFDKVREVVEADAKRFSIQEVVYDPWRATQLAKQLAKGGARVVEVGQTAKHMGSAFDEMLSALKAGRFHHNGHPVLEWMAANTMAKTVTKGVVVPAKEKPESPLKIDGIVAIVMGISRAMLKAPQGSMSSWLAAAPVKA